MSLVGQTGFATDARVAREAFLAACAQAGLAPIRHDPDRGSGPPADTARLGAPGARHLLVLCSAAGGRGGFAGAGFVTAMLAGPLRRLMPRGVAAVLVHALNPLGPVWPALPDQPSQRARAAPGAEESWTSTLLANADKRFRDYARVSEQAMRGEGARMPDPAFGAATLAAIADAHCRDAERAVLIDMRPGPGRLGAVDILAGAPAASAAAMRARDWFSAQPAPLPPGGAAPSGGLARHLGAAEATPLIAEIGTRAQETVLGRLAADGPAKPAVDPLPANPEWRAAVLSKGEALIARAIARLASPSD